MAPYCYVLPLLDHKFVVWYVARHSQLVEFTVLDADRLVPLPESIAVCRGFDPGPERVAAIGGRVAQIAVPAALAGGRHRIEFPESLSAIAELLVLVPLDGTLTIWIVSPREASVEVHPQAWFNHLTHDIGYEWVTRVGRHPETGRIVGEGFRIDPFTLDEANRRVAGPASPALFAGPPFDG